MDFGPTVSLVSRSVSFCSWPDSLDGPRACFIPPPGVWDDWWTLSPARSSACHAQMWWACVLVGEGAACAGLSWGSPLLGAASPLRTVTCLTGPWSGTPTTEIRPWHPGTKLSCFCCSWHIYHESIMCFTLKNHVILYCKSLKSLSEKGRR